MSNIKTNKICLCEIIPNILLFVRSCIAWVILRLFGICCTFKEVKHGKYFSNKTQLNFNSVEIKSSDKILELSKDIYKDENYRRSSVNEKCKVLLTISTILLAVASLILKNMPFSFLLLLPILFIFLTVFMLLIYFDVGNYSRPDINENMTKIEPEKFNAELSKDYILCVENNTLTHNFLVDIYRVAKNSLLMGLTLMICVFVMHVNIPSYFKPTANASKPPINSSNPPNLSEVISASEPSQIVSSVVKRDSEMQKAMPEIYYSPLIGKITAIVGIILFLFGIISCIYLYIRPKANFRYFLTAFWAVIPPVWFMLEYNVLYRCYGIHTSEVMEHLKYNQQLATIIWVGIGAILGVELLILKYVQNKNN